MGKIIAGPFTTITPVEEGDVILDDLKLEIHGFKEQFHKNILDEILKPIKEAKRASGRKTKTFREVLKPELPRSEVSIRDFGGIEKLIPQLPINPLIPGLTTIQRIRREENPRAPPSITSPGRLTILTDISASMSAPDLNVFEGSRWESAWMLTLGLIECASARKDILSVILYDEDSHIIVKESMDYEKAFKKIYPMKNITHGGTKINCTAEVAAGIAENGKTSTILITDVESVAEVIDGAKYINQCMMHGPVILLWITKNYSHVCKDELLQKMPCLIVMPDYPTGCEAFVTRNLKTIMNILPLKYAY